MAIPDEMRQKIMGAPDSPTGRLVASRRDPTDAQLETGVWYSNFARVKQEAESRGLPLIAMWTNGDLCGLCKRFTNNINEPAFVEWMKTSNCLFCLGGSMDDNDDGSRGGALFRWVRGPGDDVVYFPFIGVAQVESGKTTHEFHGSGHDYDQRKQAPDGTPLVIAKIKEILSSAPGAVAASKPTQSSPTPVQQNQRRLAIRFNQEWDANKIARFQNALKESGGHCICKKDRTPDTMCMCREFLMQNKPGMCHCGAFEKFVV